MKKKEKNNPGSDTDKAWARAASVNLKKPQTDEPLAEKDEVKQVEQELRQRLSKNKK